MGNETEDEKSQRGVHVREALKAERCTRWSTSTPAKDDMQTEKVTKTMTPKLKQDAFSLNFKDVENTIRRFNGKDSYPIKLWIDDFEKVSGLE